MINDKLDFMRKGPVYNGTPDLKTSIYCNQVGRDPVRKSFSPRDEEKSRLQHTSLMDDNALRYCRSPKISHVESHHDYTLFAED